jgi:hypothetical protein
MAMMSATGMITFPKSMESEMRWHVTPISPPTYSSDQPHLRSRCSLAIVSGESNAMPTLALDSLCRHKVGGIKFISEFSLAMLKLSNICYR